MDESIPIEQLATHNSLKSLWIAVHGHVYDLTNFSSDHPGGIEVLESCAGTDGTESYDYAGHSDSNMAKMQQFRVGTLAGNLPPTLFTSLSTLSTENKRINAATSGLKHLNFSLWTKVAVTIFASTLLVALSSEQRGNFAGCISWSRYKSHLQSGNSSSLTTGYAFWVGVAIASSASCVGFGYLYKLFLSTLDYENEVFKMPPTIPKKSKR